MNPFSVAAGLLVTRRLQIIMILLPFCVVVQVFMYIHGSTTKKPMGIKMCERECQCLKGCYAIQYDTVSLQCTTLTDHKDEVKGSPSLITKTVPTVEDSLLSCRPEICSEGEHSVLNRHHQPVCIPSEVQTPMLQQDCRLLVVLKSGLKSVAFEMNLVTTQMWKRPCNWHSVLHILSVRKEMKLVVLTAHELIMSVSHKESVVCMWRDVQLQAMCADEERGMLFLATSSNQFIDIYRMTTAGQRKKRIIRHSFLRIIAADTDPDQQNMYVMTGQGVLSVDYDGSNEMMLYASEASNACWLRYDSEYKEVYYYDSNTNGIKARSTGGTRLVLKTDIPPNQVQIHDGAMYFASKDVGEVYSASVRGEDNVLRTHVLPEHGDDIGDELILSIIAVQP